MRDLGIFWGTFLPPGLPATEVEGEVREEVREGAIPTPEGMLDARFTLRRLYPSARGLKTLAAYLRVAQRRALAVDIEARIGAFHALAQPWLKERPEAPITLAIAAATGFSPSMVAHALALEQRSSQGPHLRRALRRELGHEGALEGFFPSPLSGGRVMAIGPALVGSVTSANIPGLPHLEVMRALLVKAACLAKVPSGEPLYLAHYARALAARSPLLGETLAVVALDRGDAPLQRRFADLVDHLSVYGGLDAIAAWREAAGPMPATWHGHKVGVAALAREVLGGSALPALLGTLAYDFSIFDQEACLSPAVLYVEEGGEVSPREIALALRGPMAEEARRRPPRSLSTAEAAARRRFVEGALLRGGEVVDAPSGWPYIILLDPDPTFGPNAPGRILRVCPIPDLGALPELLSPLGSYLQNGILEATEARRIPLAHALARLGLSRLTRPGLMGRPSMMWMHDGGPCLGAMVRFCDEEVRDPGSWGGD